MTKVAAFIKRSYKVSLAFIGVIVFFQLYNVYIVDHSLVNLRLALNSAAEAQTIQAFEKIKPLLKVPVLKEISQSSVSARELLSLESAENVAGTAKSLQQIEQIKFYLKAIIETKKKQRGAFLSFLDDLNSHIFRPELKLSKKELESEAKNLVAKIATFKDKEMLQKAYFELGNIYLQLANLKQAEEAFLKAAALVPDNQLAIKAKFNLAWAYKNAGKYKEAITRFEQLAKEFPKSELSPVSGLQVADTFYKKGDFVQSRDKYAQVATENPKFAENDLALTLAGEVSYFKLNDKEAALKYFAEAQVKYPNSTAVKTISLQMLKDMAREFRQKGFKMLEEKTYNSAIENFQEAIKYNPSDSGSFGGTGLAFYWLDKRQEALNEANKAINSKVLEESAIVNSLFIYINSGFVDDAIRIGQEVANTKRLEMAEFYYNLGCAYLLKAKIEQATAQFERAIQINPDFVFAYNNLAYAYWAKARYSDAIKMFKGAIDRDTKFAPAYFNLGIAYFYLNRLDESYVEFKKVLNIDPENAKAKEYTQRIETMLNYQP